MKKLTKQEQISNLFKYIQAQYNLFEYEVFVNAKEKMDDFWFVVFHKKMQISRYIILSSCDDTKELKDKIKKYKKKYKDFAEGIIFYAIMPDGNISENFINITSNDGAY